MWSFVHYTGFFTKIFTILLVPQVFLFLVCNSYTNFRNAFYLLFWKRRKERKKDGRREGQRDGEYTINCICEKDWPRN